MGVVIGPEGIKMEKGKVKRVLEWPTPKCVKDVQKFLGLANYYRRFIEGFASIARLLSQTSFSLYLHNKWTGFHKLSCAGKPQMRAIGICAGCTKATTND